jgi:DNA processing protein
MSPQDQDRFDRLRLIRSANIGPISYFQLINRFGNAAAALDAIPALASRAGGRAPKLADPDTLWREIETVDRLGAQYLFVGQGHYPPLLAELDTAPPALIVKGNLRLFERPAVALVGARNASAAACRFGRELAAQLAREGVLVVSGLARGIDSSAHEGALAHAHSGSTAGVIASGIDIVYPPQNERLQAQIAEQGILIAEQPPGTAPLARHFPSRNRIIAGMSVATVVVEAAPKSGSLITARLATEAGREVMAVPGSPLDPRAQGCNQLIRDGATLIQSAADVLDSIQTMSGKFAQPMSRYDASTPDPLNDDPSDTDRRTIHNLLSPAPVPVDELIRQSGLSSAQVNMILLELELGGQVERHAGGRVSTA